MIFSCILHHSMFEGVNRIKTEYNNLDTPSEQCSQVM